MRVLIVSDTHGDHYSFKKAIRAAGDIDMIIHCGDTEGGEREMTEIAGDVRTVFVMGNNDYFSQLPREMELTLDGHKIWVTHGHSYGVSLSYEKIGQEAYEREVEAVLFGHTHRPCIATYHGVSVVNPGSLTYPRQEGRDPSYIVMETEPSGELHFDLFFL